MTKQEVDMFKEKGYDAYLAQKVKKGLEDIEQGRVYSLEEANAEWLQVIEQLKQDEQVFEQEVAYG